MQAGEEFVLTIRNPAVIKGKKALGVSYEAFVDDVQVTHRQCMLAQWLPDHMPYGFAYRVLFLLSLMTCNDTITQFSCLN